VCLLKRKELCFCGSGKKYKRCHYPINENSKLAKIHIKTREYNDYSISVMVKNTCPHGCNKCCQDYFFISIVEFYLILERLLQTKDKLDEYIEKAIKYEQSFKQLYPKEFGTLSELMPNNYLNQFEDKYFSDNRVGLTKLDCIFINDKGKCDIYNFRPSICRLFGTEETCKIIQNKSFKSEFRKELLAEIISINGNGQRIIERPYPIFYFFSHFLSEEYKDQTIHTTKMFRDVSEEQFLNYKMRLHQR